MTLGATIQTAAARTTTTLSKRERNRAEKHARALDAALKIFAKFGYTAATMDAIAAEAGLTKPTLYQYFSSKDELFRQIILAPREVMLLTINDSRTNCHVAQLHEFSWAYTKTVMRKDFLSLARLVIGDAQRNPDLANAYQINGPDRVLEGLVNFITKQATLGKLVIEDAEMAAEDFWGLILSAPRNRALHNPDAFDDLSQLSKYVHNGIKIFLRGYSANPDADLERLAEIIKETIIEGKL